MKTKVIILSISLVICAGLLSQISFGADRGTNQVDSSSISDLVLRSYRLHAVSQCDSLYHLLYFSLDTLNSITYSVKDNVLNKNVYIDGAVNNDIGDDLWRSNVVDGKVTIEYLGFEKTYQCDEVETYYALRHVMTKFKAYTFFTIPFLSGIWAKDGNDILHFTFLKSKNRNGRFRINSKSIIHLSEPLARPTTGVFYDVMSTYLLSGLPKVLKITNDNECSVGDKHVFVFEDIVIVVQNGQQYFQWLYETLGEDEMNRGLLCGWCPWFLVGKN